MAIAFSTGTHSLRAPYYLPFRLLPEFFSQRSNLFQTLAPFMGSQGPSKRPICPNCSKPSKLCLCSRLKSPPLDNSIGVTILQHSLEAKHPLNSARVAKIGLKNVTVIPVTDVNFQARFFIRPLGSDSSSGDSLIDGNRSESSDLGGRSDFVTTHSSISEDFDWGAVNCCNSDECGDVFDVLCRNKSPRSSNKEINLTPVTYRKERLDFDECITVTKAKCKVTCSQNELEITVERSAKPNIDWVLRTPIGRALISNGFVVKKLQRKQLSGTEIYQDFEEFEITVLAGSALLFPYERSINLDSVDFEVKHLVVLDGTWAKAKRIYHENPWLKLLPHLKLDPGKESLYSEVRHQPKAGCLSTIESIVCALKGLGNDMEGLDELLDVFESMIGDQRRCKEEKFRAMSQSLPGT
ncbi:uncharacterized protein LOC109707696 [Ananas comosus]|uniref:tRNA-uridine aminocarboxypropyltransferase n=2 Tax=Ananas comosus TaxID=4615 RepID=A0A199VVU1_ANACO|nr:uncharacterized protein LOC109707696 [Ananas comosus]OAY81051.1 hypothetical protein ACMD2_11475 [Ananas comosus]